MNLDIQFRTKFLNIIKLVLLLVTFGFIFYKLVYAYHIKSLVEHYSFEFSGTGILILFSVALLSLCNWILESAKWRLLINRNEEISFSHAFKAVLSGITLSIVTPNQIGDFAGRIIHLKTFNKIKGSLVTVIGHTAQMMMTMIFGLFAFTWFLHDLKKDSDSVNLVLNLVLAALVLISIIGYLHIHWLSKIRFSKRIRSFTEVFSYYSKRELVTVLIFAFSRYAIFLVQYDLLLHFYGVQTTLAQSLACISSTLFAQSFVPSFLLLDLGMRGASALWFFGFYSAANSQILLTAYTIWVFNIMVPGLIGLFFILKWKMNR